MPKDTERKTSRRSQRLQMVLRFDPPPPPLPQLLLLHNDEHQAVNVVVLPIPTIEQGRGLTWIVDKRPQKQVGTGQLITLSTGGRTTGVGRLASVTDLRQHWITWSVSGARNELRIRVPIPWANLTGVESVAHAKHYKSLPSIPLPHPDFAKNPAIAQATESPYEFELDERSAAKLSRHLDRITCRSGSRRRVVHVDPE